MSYSVPVSIQAEQAYIFGHFRIARNERHPVKTNQARSVFGLGRDTTGCRFCFTRIILLTLVMQKIYRFIEENFKGVLVICALIISITFFWRNVVIPNQARADFLSCMGETQYRYDLENKGLATELCNRYQYWAHE